MNFFGLLMFSQGFIVVNVHLYCLQDHVSLNHREVLGICISSVSDNGVNGNLLAALCVAAGMTPTLPNYHT